MALRVTPTIAERARPEKWIGPMFTLSSAPYFTPMAITRIRAATNTLRDELKSTLSSIRLRTPTADIIPYKIRLTPPIVAAGIKPIRQANLGQNDSKIAKQAARRITAGSNTFVRFSTPVFSPYVVLAGAPKSDAMAVASPSPISVRCSPGSFRKSLPTVEEMAHISPICSMMVAMAIGMIAIIVEIRNVVSRLSNTASAVCSLLNGSPIHAASLSDEKSTSPIATAVR